MSNKTCDEIQDEINELKRKQRELFGVVPEIKKARRIYTPDEIVVKINILKNKLYDLELEQSAKNCIVTEQYVPKKRKKYRERYSYGRQN